MSEYIVMYLNRPNDVTRAHRPSSAKCLTQLMFCSLDVNGAATDASALNWNWKLNYESGIVVNWNYNFCIWRFTCDNEMPM